MRVVVLFLLASLGLPFTSYGQSLDEVIEAGNESFATKDYYNAFRCYETVLKYVEKGRYKGHWDPLYIKYRYAEAAQRFNYFERADSMYTVLLTESRGHNMDVFARSVFNLARVKQSRAKDTIGLNIVRLNPGRLREALSLYERFLSEGLRQHLRLFPEPGEEEPQGLSQEDKLAVDAAARKGGSDCRQAIRAAEDNPAGIILSKDTLSRLPESVNSGFSDIAPVLREDGLYFSSVKFPAKKGAFRQSRIYAQVLKAAYTLSSEGRLDSILAVDTLARGGFFNDGQDFSHTLHTAITKNGEWMYFSHCPQGRDGAFCTLYRRKNMGSGWGEPEYLNINVDSARFTTTQPSISYDPRTREQWLYFASDREDARAKGGLDIWRCRVNEADGSLGAPEPLSDINSAWNDATPFLHALSGRLFFCSDRESTYGLYDNFVAKPGPSGKVVENLGLPYNSGYNDQYFSLSEDGSLAFFSSDRPESTRFIDSLNACCQDIYTYPIDNSMGLEVSVAGCGRDLTEEADIKIYDITYCDCTEGNLVEGNEVMRYHKYRIVASHGEFNSSSDTLALDWRYDGKPSARQALELSPDYVELAFFARDSTNGKMLDFGTYIVSVDPHEAESPEAIGDRAFRFNPRQKYTVEVRAKNPIYAPKKIELDSLRFVSECDSIVFVDLAIPCLPDSLENIIFYFDNDKPDRVRRDLWALTNDSYDEGLVEPYRAQRDDYLAFNLQPYTVDWDLVRGQVRMDTFNNNIDTLLNLRNPNGQPDGLSQPLRYVVKKAGGEKVQIIPDTFTIVERINRFFGDPNAETEVKGDLRENLDKFNSFTEYLKAYLATGNTIEVTLRAYCSYRVTDILSTYNDALAKRRILCVRNSLEEAGLGRYLDKTLILKELPFGASEAATNFPDPNLNPNVGVGGKLFYSAALDRRVEIINVKQVNCETGGMGLSSLNRAKNPGQP